MRHQIEIFTAGCPVCEPVVALVEETASKNCEIIIYNLSVQDENNIYITKMEKYGVKRIPAIAVDGKLIGCCLNIEITKTDLVNAGISTF